MAEENLTNLMITDLMAGKMVCIGFCERQYENINERLRKFMNEQPAFAHLIRPLFKCRDKEFHGHGEIHFTKTNSGITASIHTDECSEHFEDVQMTLDEFRRFSELTEEFGVFINDNGNNSLNI